VDQLINKPEDVFKSLSERLQGDICIGLPKFGSVQFSDYLPQTVNLDLKNQFYRFENRFGLLNLEMMEGCSKGELYPSPTFLLGHICVYQD
jgi:hypothetical protein